MWEKVLREKSSTLVLQEEYYTFITPAICIQEECNPTRLDGFCHYTYSISTLLWRENYGLG